MARKLLAYTRFSGEAQEAGDSQRRQDQLIEAASREEGVPIDYTLCLKDKGISAFRGRNWHRGHLGKFIDLVDAGIVPAGSILCIERVNRMSRLPWMKQVELWKEILSRGIVIRTCEPPARYTADNMNDLAIGCPVVIYMMLGHLESKQKSDWSFAAFDEMKRRCREEGVPHNLAVPGWIKRVTVPHPKDAERVITTGYELEAHRTSLLRWMHQQAQQGWGNRRIANHLNASGEPTWHGKRWRDRTVHYLLTTRTAIGEHQPTRTNQEGRPEPDGPPIDLYPAAITEECWRRTQAARRARKRHGGRPSPVVRNLFTHLVKDAAAELPLYSFTQSADGKSYDYLRIDGHPWAIPYRPFERAILATLAQLKARDVDGSHQADALSARVESLQQARTRLTLDLDALDQQLRELPAERWPKRAIARMAELEQSIANTDEELRVAKEQANTSTRIESHADLQSCLGRLDELERTGPPEAVTSLRERIKGRIPFIVESIWVRVQLENSRRRYVHVRIYLHGGEVRPLVLSFYDPTVPPLPLMNADFRGGAERGYVANARVGRPLEADAPAVEPRVEPPGDRKAPRRRAVPRVATRRVKKKAVVA